MATSRWPGWGKTPLDQRTAAWTAAGIVSPDDLSVLRANGADLTAYADTRVENVLGIHAMPWAVATNFQVNGRDILVPMAIEEPSVVAAASHGAKLARISGGFRAEAGPHLVSGQILVVDCPNVKGAIRRLRRESPSLLAELASSHPSLAERGGGARAITGRVVGDDLVVEVLVDTVDAMGANLINSMMERLAPAVARVTGGRVLLRILSNYADHCLARARCVVDAKSLARPGWAGDQVRDDIAAASRFAERDVGRAVTHNKGIMNGVDAVVVATGNDWRAVEAAAHAYAARHGRYRPLAVWRVDEGGQLAGWIELPLAVGTAGLSIWSQPTARVALKMMGYPSARELAGVIAAVGLAQNLAALLALVTEGIQRGHMALHRRVEAAARVPGVRDFQHDETR
jgi:hydroxymethylglutaryl-CoA reductase